MLSWDEHVKKIYNLGAWFYERSTTPNPDIVLSLGANMLDKMA